MQQEASVCGADMQAKGMGLWDVEARWRDDQVLLHTMETYFCNNVLGYFSHTLVATVNWDVLRI